MKNEKCQRKNAKKILLFSWFSINNSIPFYNNMFLRVDSLFALPCYFKNISDVEKSIEDHMLATNSSFSVYKMEHGFDAKGIYEFVSFASYIFCTISIFFFVINPDHSWHFRIYA